MCTKPRPTQHRDQAQSDASLRSADLGRGASVDQRPKKGGMGLLVLPSTVPTPRSWLWPGPWCPQASGQWGHDPLTTPVLLAARLSPEGIGGGLKTRPAGRCPGGQQGGERHPGPVSGSWATCMHPPPYKRNTFTSSHTLSYIRSFHPVSALRRGCGGSREARDKGAHGGREGRRSP